MSKVNEKAMEEEKKKKREVEKEEEGRGGKKKMEEVMGNEEERWNIAEVNAKWNNNIYFSLGTLRYFWVL